MISRDNSRDIRGSRAMSAVNLQRMTEDAAAGAVGLRRFRRPRWIADEVGVAVCRLFHRRSPPKVIGEVAAEAAEGVEEAGRVRRILTCSLFLPLHRNNAGSAAMGTGAGGEGQG